jgi:hypothetical protein
MLTICHWFFVIILDRWGEGFRKKLFVAWRIWDRRLKHRPPGRESNLEPAECEAGVVLMLWFLWTNGFCGLTSDFNEVYPPDLSWGDRGCWNFSFVIHRCKFAFCDSASVTFFDPIPSSLFVFFPRMSARVYNINKRHSYVRAFFLEDRRLAWCKTILEGCCLV